MTVEIEWYIPEHILLARYSGDVVPNDIRYQYEEGIKLSEAADTSLVHLIATMDNVTSFPKTISEYRGTFGEKARNAGWVILVGDNKLIRFLGTIVSNLMRLRFTYVNSVDQALDYILARDPVLTEDMIAPYRQDKTLESSSN